MKNKIELKRALIKSFIAIILILIVFGVFQYYQYKKYTNNFNNKIAQIVSKVKEKYPDLDNNEIMQIINSKENIDTNLFKNYGINLQDDAILIENDNYFKIFFFVL